MNNFSLEDRVAAVVTGAGGGLGGGICSALTLKGAAVPSDAASFITGQTIEIDSGRAMR